MSSSLECLQFTHERDRETTKSRRRIKEEGCDDGMVHDGKRLGRERTSEAANDVQPPGSALYDVFKVQVPFTLSLSMMPRIFKERTLGNSLLMRTFL